MKRGAFAANDADWCYHGGEFVKLGDVRLSPATQALNYGTGVYTEDGVELHYRYPCSYQRARLTGRAQDGPQVPGESRDGALYPRA